MGETRGRATSIEMVRTLSSDDHHLLMRGLAVQPFLTAALGYVLFPPSEAAIVLGVFFGITGTVITGCVAYPLVRWLIERGRLTLRRTLAGGAVLGNIPAAIAAVSMLAARDAAVDPAQLLRPAAIGTWVGIVSAAVFWMLSGRHFNQPGGSAA